MASNSVLTLPNIRNGVLTLGDLWDIRRSERVGFNLFGKNLTGADSSSTAGSEAIRKRKEEIRKLVKIKPSDSASQYEFKHNKNSKDSANNLGLDASVTIDLLAGMIVVTGGFGFEVGWSKGLTTEEIFLLCNYPKHKIYLDNKMEFVNRKNYYDNHVFKLLEEGKLPSATHIVTEMEIGGRLTSSIKITQKENGDRYKVKLYLEANINLFLLQGTFKASVTVGEDIKVTNYNAIIDVDSLPPIEAPTNVKDFADNNNPPSTRVQKNFEEELAKMKFFDYWLQDGEEKLVGIPIKFTLEPLRPYWILEVTTPGPTLPSSTGDESTVEMIKETENNAMNSLLTLKDWSGEDYLKRKILGRISMAQNILKESTHPITKEIQKKEELFKKHAEKLRTEILNAYIAFKKSYYPFKDNSALHKFREEIKELNDEINRKSSDEAIKNEEDPIIEKCKKEIKSLGLFTKTDKDLEDATNPIKTLKYNKDNKTPIQFFTNETDVQLWLQTQRMGKILYRAEGNVSAENASVISKIADEIYKLAIDLNKINIQLGVAYPSVSGEMDSKIVTPPSKESTMESSEKVISNKKLTPDLEKLPIMLSQNDASTQNLPDGSPTPDVGETPLTLDSGGSPFPLPSDLGGGKTVQSSPSLKEVSTSMQGSDKPTHNFILSTPTGLLSYNILSTDDPTQPNSDVSFILDVFKAFTSQSQNGVHRIGHLYSTYGELHGFKMKLDNLVNTIPLLTLLKSYFGGVNIGHTRDKTLSILNSASNTDKLLFLFPPDPVESSRSVIHSLLQLLHAEVPSNQIVCGTLDVSTVMDSPLLFLVWNGKLIGICMDQLDFLLFLHIYKTFKDEPIISMEKAKEYFRPSLMIPNGLCSHAKIEYSRIVYAAIEKEIAPEARDSMTKGDSKYSPDIDDLFVDMLTAAVYSPISPNLPSNKTFVDVYGKFAVNLLEKSFSRGDFGNYFEGQSFNIGSHLNWPEVSLALDNFQNKSSEFKKYNKVEQLYTIFRVYASNIKKDEPNNTTKSTDKPPPPSTSGEQYDAIIKALDKDLKDDFKKILNSIKSMSNLHINASAHLYCSVLGEELGFLGQEIIKKSPLVHKKLHVLRHLKRIVTEMQNNQRVLQHIVHSSLTFFIREFLEKYPIQFPPEIIDKIKKNLKLERYYHILSDVVENTPSRFPHREMSVFQLELNRLKSMTDTNGIIRLIQQMETFVDENTLTSIWSNPSFQYMIKSNIGLIKEEGKGNEFIQRALSRATKIHLFIPKDIDRELQSYDFSAENEPVGFSRTWDTKEKLLKSFQLLWVSQIMPLKFQRYLLINTLATDGVTYKSLHDANALFYWNEQAKYFEEPWDLSTIRTAIRLLMGEAKESLPITSIVKKKEPLGDPSLRNKDSSHAGKLNLQDYLELSFSPSSILEKDLTPSTIMYYTKFSKRSADFNSGNPFMVESRVDLLTNLLSSAESPLQSEILNIFYRNCSNEYALPLIISDPSNAKKYTSFIRLYFKKEFYNQQQRDQLPKIVTIIRIGNHSTGKSQLLNKIIMKSLHKAFASGPFKPQFLKGYTDFIYVNESNANPIFYKQIGRKNFILVNLHGNALELPEHLEILKTITSCFLVCFPPHLPSQSKIDEGKMLLKSKSNLDDFVGLYIDPGTTLKEKLSPEEIVLSPFSIHDIEEIHPVSKLIQDALKRKAQLPSSLVETNSTTESFRHWKLSPLAVEFTAKIFQQGVKVVKEGLMQQKGRENPSPDQLKLYWDNNSEMFTKLFQILEQPNSMDILSDLAELISLHQDGSKSYQNATKAWIKLNAMNAEEFNHVCFGSTSNHQLSLKQEILLGHFQNNVDSNRISVMQLLTEMCMINDMSITTNISNIQNKMLPLFLSGCELPVPSSSDETFFGEPWSKELLSLLPNYPVAIISCLGSDPLKISNLIDSLFGINFLSSSSCRSPTPTLGIEWSDRMWNGISMRLIHFSDKLKSKLGIQGLLLLHSKPQSQKTFGRHSSLLERDRQLATFLMSVSDITMIFDYDNYNDNFSDVIDTSILGLNKMPSSIEDAIPQLFFLRSHEKDEFDARNEIQKKLKEIEKVGKDCKDYKELSNIGRIVLDKAINSIENNSNSFACNSSASLLNLSDSILSLLLGGKYTGLRNFVQNFGPTWSFVEMNIKFQFFSLKDILKDDGFRAHLNKVLNLVDTCFMFHTEDFPNILYKELSEIINSWIKGEYGQVSPIEKLRQLNLSLAGMVNNILEDCSLVSQGPCTKCEEYLAKKEFKDNDDSMTLKLQKMIDKYSRNEKSHYQRLARQMLFAIEERLLEQEQSLQKKQGKPAKKSYISYKDMELNNDPIKKMSLERTVVGSLRRAKDEVEFIFGPSAAQILVWDDKDSIDKLNEFPAFEKAAGNTGSKIKAESLNLDELPMKWIKDGGYQGIFHGGLTRRIIDDIDEKLTRLQKDQILNPKKQRLLPNYRMKVYAYVLHQLFKILKSLEINWKQEFDPFTIFLKRIEKGVTPNV